MGVPSGARGCFRDVTGGRDPLPAGVEVGAVNLSCVD